MEYVRTKEVAMEELMILEKLFKRRRNKKQHQKRWLKVERKNDVVHIKGHLNEKITASELWLIDKDTKEGILVGSSDPTSNFHFKIELEQIASRLEAYYDIDEKSLSWYIKVKKPLALFTANQLEEKNESIAFTMAEDQIEYGEYFMQLGGFYESYIDGVEYISNSFSKLTIYISPKGNISLLFNKNMKRPTKLQLEKFKAKNNIVYIEGRFFTKSLQVESGEMVLISRGEDVHTLSFDVDFQHLKEETSKRYGLHRYLYSASISLLTETDEFVLNSNVYDLFLDVKFEHGYEKRIRIGRPTLKTKLLTKSVMASNYSTGQVVYPYYTLKASNLSFEVINFPKENFNYLKKMMRWSWFVKLINKNKDVWIVGERPYKAQDTGYQFFKYMRETHPEKEVYYVINEDSPEKRNVDPFGNVLRFGSKEHILLTLIAKKVISSHHPDYLYPVRTKSFQRKVNAKKVFLQHGVMGTKNLTAHYGKVTSDFETNLFIVSSEYEKEIVVNDLDYDPQEVMVTGLSRFDALFRNDVKIKKQILIIPTWRDWLATADRFYGSEYYERYNDLINNEKFLEMAKKNDIDIVFCLHPNMQQYSGAFTNPAIKIVKQGEIDVQQLIKESALMITDYSSVAFDFSFLEKPIIYYQFDRQRFLGKWPSHLVLDQDLPGDIVLEEDSLVDCVEKYINNNLQMEQRYKERSRRFLKYKDVKSNERIYAAIKNQDKVKQSFVQTIQYNYIARGVFNRFRKSSYYFPVMKRMYSLMRIVIKPDPKMIFLESGLGKQYADSPRYIYEKLTELYPDKYTFIWVYNKRNIRFDYKHTKKIKRLNPAYYYYLCKSGVWINNQNFPTYIKKPAETKYLQTWHGTPLKKMLHDIEEIQGRSEDYLERVSTAVENWDYLISPSTYATKAFRSAFNYDNKVLEVGYPRNDLFYADDKETHQQDLRMKLAIPQDKKVILYAPTFRDNQKRKNKFSFDLNMDLDRMQKELGDEYVLLLRMHVIVSSKIKINPELRGFVYNVSNYPEMQELLLIADLLVTDYSSVMFDYCNTKRPILFYTYDLEEYRDKLRGFYFDFEEQAPGPFVTNTEQLIDSIKQIENVKEDYRDKYTAFYNKFCYLEDGHATDRVINTLIDKE